MTYAGRLVVVGKTNEPFICYRVSSRSFPGRIAKISGNSVKVSLKSGIKTDNPYVEYTCIKKSKDAVIASNGTHTDLIASNYRDGMSMREAIFSALREMGYEKDGYNTPRVAGAIVDNKGYLGIVKTEGVEIQEFPLREGFCRIISTNTFNSISEKEYPFSADTAYECARFVADGDFFRTLEHFVCSAAHLRSFSTFNPWMPTPREAISLLREAGCNESVIKHCKKVRDASLSLMDEYKIKADRNLVEIGALLHDIGRCKSHGYDHAIYGYEFLKERNLPISVCNIALHHIGSGIDKKTAVKLNLPPADYSPKTIEEKIVCFADILVADVSILSYREALLRNSQKFGPHSSFIKKMKKLHKEITGHKS